MRQAVVGLLAHVDAGKTTLAESMLATAGAIRSPGRVDSGSSHLDTDAMERERGITIFSASVSLDWADAHIMLLDAPGHVDFSAEAERTLAALDYAILVVGANDGVQGHTETLWDLLSRHEVPTLVFVNKCDLENPGREGLLAELASRLSPGCVDASALLAGDSGVSEDAASTDEAALEEYLETGALAAGTLRRLVAGRAVFPVFFGAALRDDGVRELLDGMCALLAERSWPGAFAARVYRVSRGTRGERLAWVKVTGGTLRAKTRVTGMGRRGEPWAEKINEVRLYQGASFETVAEVPAGRICAVTGLSHVVPGSALGAEPEGARPLLAPVLSYRVIPEPGADASALVRALRELADEDPMLGVTWQEQLQEAHVQLMGEVQQDVIAELLRGRYGFAVTFGPGGILYRETVSAPVEGVGHFEPLRHYAEVRLLVEPLPRGSGVEFGTRCPVDDLDLNWQRLILTNAMERDHLGVLTGAPLTDVRITLLAGRAHAKHTEGGDFRQATYRAVRQALMGARERGECRLLEPWYRLRLVVPAERVGRALADLTRMGAEFDAPTASGDVARITGEVPASEVGEYALEVARYTGGRGRLSLELAGYRECHDAGEVVAAAAYDPEADLPNTPDSVFCSHGAGHTVKWRDVPAAAHTVADAARLRPYRPADAAFFSN
ncbi:MAG TPA: TetM/TetW/TetO/TetS family tetracycline resistance ribosomal protection protein [Candidatus Olsenella excrementavium]|uniref:TetM/TetW/TetO/TetS family tetracycline resistance ribosomal protection protein n=1 Tax=Candidatus Olsenella excrementavium TaxID=2838709 RepID=A0A9D2CG07_9ACTN|nr:TetM/TetW/TetO/TetS family tetracycline resistance ribosomal protection protein [Candidatus Olsenella excrementavium]